MSPKNLRNLLTAAVVLILGAAAAAALIKLGGRPERQTPPPSRPMVDAYTVKPDDEPIRIKSFGSVQAKRKVEVVARVGGDVRPVTTSTEPMEIPTASPEMGPLNSDGDGPTPKTADAPLVPSAAKGCVQPGLNNFLS